MLDLPLSADYFLDFFLKSGAPPHIAERTRDIAVMQSLVANDFGYSIANMTSMARQAPDGKPLVFLPLSGDVPPLRLGLLSVGGSRTRQILRSFANHCATHVPPMLAPRPHSQKAENDA